MSSTEAGRYAMLTTALTGTTGTGLDRFVQAIARDTGLAGANTASDLQAGAAAADALDHLIVEAAQATGAAADGRFTADEVVAMNTWIRTHHLADWITHHGDDDSAGETGFHRVQEDGGLLKYRGQPLIDTVLDGIYHLGFEIVDGRFRNEDGDANASVEQVAAWLTQFWTDRATTGTGLDRLILMIQADTGLAQGAPEADIAAGLDAANALNQLILDGLRATGGLDDGAVSAEDVVALNAWIRSDPARYTRFEALHGDDERTSETGFHPVQNDGGSARLFGRNLVNTVADGLYHIGFEIRNGQFLNEDGNANARVSDVAAWLNHFLCDPSTTGTGLDRIVDTLMVDPGLTRNTAAPDILGGAHAADRLNHLLLTAMAETGAADDGWVTEEDLVAMNAWVRADEARYMRFLEWHGDDEEGTETGYHLMQNDGATTDYFGRNLANSVADGLYHFGFAIADGHFLNEDGDPNASLGDVAMWLNYFVHPAATLLVGDDTASWLEGTGGDDQIVGRWCDDTLIAAGGQDYLVGYHGDDVLLGGDGDDLLQGDGGDDRLDGGEGSDTYRVEGNQAGGWASFAGFDTYADSGTGGTDRIVATGASVDIGVRQFSATTSGIELIDASGATSARLLGDWSDDLLDVRGVALLGSVVLDGYYGNDTLLGNADDNTLRGAGGDDRLDGGEGSDTYRVEGNQAGGWASFTGFDTYTDSGTGGTDRIVATGASVDIGVRQFSAATSGIELIDASGATSARLLGDWSDDLLDVRGVALLGSVVLDGYYGNDTLLGNADDNTLRGAGGDDRLDGGEGSDTYRVEGNQAGGWASFAGFDTYTDSGTGGTDRIVATGASVDIGVRQFSATTSGIELIDASGATSARLLGDWSNDLLDLRGVAVLGRLVLDGYQGNDTLVGSAAADELRGGQGQDWLSGGGGADTLDGGAGNDLLILGNGQGGLRELAIGGSGKDRFALMVTDGSALDLRGGGSAGGDGSTDVYTLVGSAGPLALTARILDFERGKDRLDLSQLRDAGQQVLGWEDLLLSRVGADTQIGFAAGVHGSDGRDIAVTITLVGLSTLGAGDVVFSGPSLPTGLPGLDAAALALA